MSKNLVEPGRSQITIRRMRFACWISKTTRAHPHTYAVAPAHMCIYALTHAPSRNLVVILLSLYFARCFIYSTQCLRVFLITAAHCVGCVFMCFVIVSLCALSSWAYMLCHHELMCVVILSLYALSSWAYMLCHRELMCFVIVILCALSSWAYVLCHREFMCFFIICLYAVSSWAFHLIIYTFLAMQYSLPHLDLSTLASINRD